MTREIRNYYTNAVIWTGEAETVRDAIHAALATGANLTGANLTDADLRGANLTDADLTDADLRGANLTDADLRGANLTGANLTDADLRGANLTDADLTDADLRGANLTGANLRGFRDDLWAVLSAAPAEAQAVLDALRAGRVDGSCYSGDCACLVGTIANARQCSYTAIEGLVPDSRRPAELWFMRINPGDTPDTNESAKLAAEWVETWITNVRAAFGASEVRP